MTSSPEVSSQTNTLPSLVRHSSVYSLVPIARNAAGLLLVPLYTYKLQTGQWGILELTDLLIIATCQVVGVNMLNGMTRFYFEQSTASDRNAVVTSGTLAMSLTAWIVVGALLLLRDELGAFLFPTRMEAAGGENLTRCLVVALLIIPLSISTNAGFEYLKMQHRSVLYAGVQIAKLLLEIILKIWMLVGLEWGVYGFLLSTLIGEALTSTLLTGSILWRLRPRIVLRVLKPMVAYTLPLVPVGLFQLGLHQADRFILKALAPAELALVWVGLYGFGYKIGYLVNSVLLGSFLQIWHPWVYGVSDPRKRAAYVARISTYAVLAIASASVFVILFGRQAIQLLAGQDAYHPSFRVVPWVATGYVFWALYNVSQMPMFVAKRTLPLLWINLTALALNVALNIALVPRLGYVGPAFATLGTFAALAAMGAIAGRSLAEVPFEAGRLLATIVTVLAAALLAAVIDGSFPDLPWNPVLVLAPKVSALVMAQLLLWFLVLRRDERAAVLDWLRAKRKAFQSKAAGPSRVGDEGFEPPTSSL